MTIVFLNMSRLDHWKQGAVNRNYHVVRKIIARKDVDNVIIVDQIPHSTWAKTKHIGKEMLQTKSLPKPNKTKRIQVGDKYIWHISTSSLPMIKRQIHHIQKGEGPLILWSFNPFFTPLTAAFPDAHIIFDTVDNWTEHHIYRNYRAKITKLYHRIDQQADCIFTVSEDAKALFPTNRNVYWIPNGVDTNHFQDTQIHQKLQNIPRPIVGYHGIIEHRVDFDLVAQVAKLLPDLSFVFVGPIWRTADTSPVQGLSNVYFPGPIPYQEIPQALQGFSIGWIPHRVNEFTKSMNPLKLVEYAAMKKPIVSTPVAGIDAFGEGLHIMHNAEEAVGLIQNALAMGPRQDLRTAAEKRAWGPIANRMYETAWQCIHTKEDAPIEETQGEWEWPES